MAKLIVLLSLALGGAVVVAAPAHAAPVWTAVTSPNPPRAPRASLAGVACPTSTTCLVAGSYADGADRLQPFVGRSNGAIWAMAPAPVPPGLPEAHGQLSAIACSTATNCFAVGQHDNGSQTKTLIVRWNGAGWTIVSSHKPPNSTQSSLSGITCPTSTRCFAVGSYHDGSRNRTLVERWTGGDWTIVASPNPAGSAASVLAAIACPTATACFAVGVHSVNSTTIKPLIERWNGSSWSVVPSPIPAGTSISRLAGVSCATATSCFAVGSRNTSPTLPKTATLIERWNGTAWSVVPSPVPAGSARSRLAGISCPTTTTCLAVGTDEHDVGPPNHALVVRWNGASWSTANNPSEGRLDAISCLSTTSCLAAGSDGIRTLLERWNGATWVELDAGGSESELRDVSCISATSCFAIGQRNDANGIRTLIERWNGTSWSFVASPNAPGASINILDAVSCPAASTCFAVGNSSLGTLIERWNGAAWSVAAPPVAGDLSDVTCSSATSCVAVGSTNSQLGPLVLRWNGTSWATVPIPKPSGARAAFLLGVSCPTATSCTAVGGYIPPAPAPARSRTLIERWNGIGWAIVPSPNPAGADSRLSDVACAATSMCMAVGVHWSASVSIPIVERWNGTSWVIVPTPAGINDLHRVACPAVTTCFAVGVRVTGSPSNRVTLVERWNGTSWAIVASPNRAAPTNVLEGVACTTPTACIAVGWYDTGYSRRTLVEQYA